MKKFLFIVILAVIILVVASSEFDRGKDIKLDEGFKQFLILEHETEIQESVILKSEHLNILDTNQYSLILSNHIESTAYV